MELSDFVLGGFRDTKSWKSFNITFYISHEKEKLECHTKNCNEEIRRFFYSEISLKKKFLVIVLLKKSSLFVLFSTLFFIIRTSLIKFNFIICFTWVEGLVQIISQSTEDRGTDAYIYIYIPLLIPYLWNYTENVIDVAKCRVHIWRRRFSRPLIKDRGISTIPPQIIYVWLIIYVLFSSIFIFCINSINMIVQSCEKIILEV